MLPGGGFFTGIVRDISQRKEAEQAQALLVEAGTVLAQSLDVDTTLEEHRLAGGDAPGGLLHAWICWARTGSFHRLEVLARDPVLQEVLQQVDGVPAAAGLQQPAGPRASRRAPRSCTDITPEWLDAVARNAEHRAVLEELGPRVGGARSAEGPGPEAGGDQPGLEAAGPRMAGPSMVAVAQGLADRAAIAIDNARLYQEARDAVRVREDVVAIVSHDLRNPLNAISLSAATLIKREELDDADGEGGHAHLRGGGPGAPADPGPAGLHAGAGGRHSR